MREINYCTDTAFSAATLGIIKINYKRVFRDLSSFFIVAELDLSVCTFFFKELNHIYYSLILDELKALS